MNPLEEIAEQLKKAWGGQTLATMREEASKELNGACFKALRHSDGRRSVILFCATGEHELAKLEKAIGAAPPHSFGDWSAVSLFEAVARTMLGGGLCYDREPNSPQRSSALVLIAAGPDSVIKMEELLSLPP
jgi:hypothetical protein